MLPDVSLLNFPRPAEVPARGGSLGHAGDGQDGDRAGRGPPVPRGAPRPPARAGQGRAARQFGGAGAAPGGCSGPAPGLGQRCPGLRRGRGAPGPGGTGTGHGSGTASPAELRALPHGASSDGGLGPLPPGQDGASRLRCASRGGQPRPPSPFSIPAAPGYSRAASAPRCQPGALELQSPAATEVASELHAKPFFHYLFIYFPPTQAVPPSWPEWKSMLKSRTRLSHVVSLRAAVTAALSQGTGASPLPCQEGTR